MTHQFSRLQEVLRDLLTFHPASKMTGVDTFQQQFCAALTRAGQDLYSVRGMFDEHGNVRFLIQTSAAAMYPLYESLRIGMRPFFFSQDFGVAPETQQVLYVVRGVRDFCSKNGPAHNDLTFGMELLRYA